MMECICEQQASICAALVDVNYFENDSDFAAFFRLQIVLVGKAMVRYHQSGLFFIICLMIL